MAGEWNIGTITLRHGTPARRTLDFTWEDGSPRELAETGYLRIYSDSGTTLLMPEVTLSAGDALSQRVVSLTAAQCTQPVRSAGYYLEIEFRDVAGNIVPDSGWYGLLKFAGR